MRSVTLLMLAAFSASGLHGCGGESSVRTVTVTSPETSPEAAPTSAPLSGRPALIETRITDARRHIGEVVEGSVIGEAAFCRGGETSGGSEGATITSTFRCREGTLTLRFAPTQRSLVQGAPWEIVEGTGEFEGLSGGGSMVASFDEETDIGREVFVGEIRE